MAPKNPFSKKKKTKEASKASKPHTDDHTTPGRPVSSPPIHPSFGLKTILPLPFQQRLLDVFASAFPGIFDEDLSSKIQGLKGYLYMRDFKAAFRDPGLLEAYAVRWSPTRALAYADVFLGLLEGHWSMEGSKNRARECAMGKGRETTIGPNKGVLDDRKEPAARETNVVGGAPESHLGSRTQTDAALGITCIGAGGGAELAALWTTMSHFLSTAVDPIGIPLMDVTLVDNGPWLPIFQSLMDSIMRSKQHNANNPPAEDHLESQDTSQQPPAPRPQLQHRADFLTYNFQRLDILSPKTLHILSPKLQECDILTIAFTLNELFTTSRPQTTLFLLHLTDLLPPGALLLIIDSPGSYATVTYTKICVRSEGEETTTEKASYPMTWLLERVLFVECAEGKKGQEKWEKVEKGEESRWHRLDKGLEYPIALEDMRFQMHLYRRV